MVLKTEYYNLILVQNKTVTYETKQLNHFKILPCNRLTLPNYLTNNNRVKNEPTTKKKVKLRH